MNLKGTFLNDSVRGKICLLIPLNNEPREKEDVYVVNALFFTFGFNALMYVFYMRARINRFIKGISPGSKMSCIGMYRRNLLDFKETLALSIAWAVNAMLYGVITKILEDFKISPKHAFFIDNFIYLFVFEVITLIIFFHLSYRDIPVNTKPPKISQFYVHCSETLEPRRPPVPKLPQPPLTPLTSQPPITYVLPAPTSSHTPHPSISTQTQQTSFLLRPTTAVKVSGKGKGVGKNRRWGQSVNRTEVHNHTSMMSGHREAATSVEQFYPTQLKRRALPDVE